MSRKTAVEKVGAAIMFLVMIFALTRMAIVAIAAVSGFRGLSWWWALVDGGLYALAGLGYMLQVAVRTTAVFRERIDPDRVGLIFPSEWPALLAKDLIRGFLACCGAFLTGVLVAVLLG